MNFRLTIILLAALLMIGAYAYYEVNKPPKEEPSAPWFYSIDFDKISTLYVRYKDKSIDLVWDTEKQQWKWADPGEYADQEIDQVRVNGIRVLLSGSKSKRLLTEKAADLSIYGLDKPEIETIAGLEDGSKVEVYIGDKTPDESSNYVKFSGYDPIYLLDYTWGDEMKRFVNEPPIVKPTPTPGIAESPTPSST